MRVINRCTGGEAVPAVLGAILLAAVGLGAVAIHVAGPPAGWMNVNLGLAFAPPVLATVLFAARRRRMMWWAGSVLLLALLPNAPYVLTDVIHAPGGLAWAHALGGSGIALGAAYLGLFTAGIVGYCYVLSLLVTDLRRHGRGRLVVPVLTATHAACAVGVWLGRVHRLNSWDAAHPRLLAAALSEAANPQALTAIAVVFVGVGAAALLVLRLTDTAAHRFGPVWRRLGGPPLSPQR